MPYQCPWRYQLPAGCAQSQGFAAPAPAKLLRRSFSASPRSHCAPFGLPVLPMRSQCAPNANCFRGHGCSPAPRCPAPALSIALCPQDHSSACPACPQCGALVAWPHSPAPRPTSAAPPSADLHITGRGGRAGTLGLAVGAGGVAGTPARLSPTAGHLLRAPPRQGQGQGQGQGLHCNHCHSPMVSIGLKTSA